MSTPIQDTPAKLEPGLKQSESHKVAVKQRIVHVCNFRSAGRLSNEDARFLHSVHETFALHLGGVLDSYIGTGVEVKLETLDQQPIREHIAEIHPLTYILPFSSNALLVEFEIGLAFPIIEMLMGGTGSAVGEARELSEIEEEITQDVVEMIAKQAQAIWRIPELSLDRGTRMKPALMHQFFAPNDKVAILKFSVSISGICGAFWLVLSSDLVNALMTQLKQQQPQKKARIWSFPVPPLRERILDCEFEVSSELPDLRVAVRDLIALRPGSVLKLRAPIRNPGMLTAGGRSIFEAAPVRNGLQRAAQLGRRIASTADWKRR